MSGGSLGYLFTREAPDAVGSWQYDDAVDELRHLGYADVADDLADFRTYAAMVLGDIEKMWEVYHAPLRALEWFLSLDIGRDELDAAMADFRASRRDD